MSNECIHDVWPASSCTICNGRVDRERAQALDTTVMARMTAKFSGSCQCDEAIDPGDPIALLSSGVWVCEDCAS